MMKKNVISSLILLLVLFFSCVPTHKKHLDALTTLLHQSQTSLNKVESLPDNTLDSLQKNVSGVLQQWPRTVLKQDSIKGIDIHRFFDLERSLKKYSKGKNTLLRLAHLSVSQITHLIQDEKEGLLSENDFKNYYEREGQELKDVQLGIKDRYAVIERIKKQYSVLWPVMLDVKDSLDKLTVNQKIDY